MNSESNLQGKRILIVDDLVEARSALKSMLTMLGADKVDSTTDGREAMEHIMERDYDLILSDYNLGKGKDGQQIIEEGRYTGRLKATSSFIMVTGENAVDRVMGALEYDPDAYITKPFTLSILRERLARLWHTKSVLRPVNEAIDAGEIDNAILLADQILAENPRLLLPISRISGKLCLRQERYDDALKAYEGVLESRPASWARLGQAVCIYHLGDIEHAKQLILDTLKDHPLYVQCHDWLAKIELGQGNREAAQKHLEAAVKISPRAVLRQMELGHLALDNGDVDTARNAFEQAVRLGRNSCYKSSENYLNFVRVAQSTLTGANSKENRLLCSKALRALDEMRQEYVGQLAVIFQANIVESKTHKLVENEEKARALADKAESTLARIKDPTSEQRLQMTETYVDTGQNEKARDMINTMKDLSLADAVKARLQALDQQLDDMNMRERSADLNAEGVRHYEAGRLEEAIEAFDNAVRYDEAGISVLLNAIQAKVSYIERNELDAAELKDCYRLLRRIGSVGRLDERYDRYDRLKVTCERLRRSAGL